MDDAISRQAVLKLLSTMPPEETTTKALLIQSVKQMDAAQPERLTDDDFETIRIHLSAFKESLCNQRRWKEAEDYERLISRFMSFASAQPECAKDFVMLKVIDLNGRPYYSIIYLENGNEFEGYSSYDLKVISEYLKRYFGFAQPETHDKRTEKHACDLIDRQPSSSCVRENDTISRRMAIDAIFGRSHEIIKMRI